MFPVLRPSVEEDVPAEAEDVSGVGDDEDHHSEDDETGVES